MSWRKSHTPLAATLPRTCRSQPKDADSSRTRPDPDKIADDGACAVVTVVVDAAGLQPVPGQSTTGILDVADALAAMLRSARP
jgi:hypothetical protein